ncbi:MAG: hypothetical protein A2934_02210 [Candidatus Sungbacteria bacterium RIFCSPLOWO2_01_FULL_47_10]|uniref:DNA-directed DNA polymerase n=1 Tax=Candidatus Sungbacteria bacterium RIFCSPLOWO2_01_FULL_47_10 TaxID=1802276 RepID=A0A1G2L6A2_9BACT|nr:MAG: hypothetical protein A2934_02210 [Candidatus Sungbacteria bacterium RIFCSPLOWO2_01_FULL_47_10]
MIYALSGPDTYRSRIKLKHIIEEFRKKSGGTLEYERFDAEETDGRTIAASGDIRSLFQEKKIVIIEWVFSRSGPFLGKERSGSRPAKDRLFTLIRPKLAKWRDSKNTIFLFWDAEIVHRKECAEFLPYASKSQEFKDLTRQESRVHLEREATERNLRLSEQEKSILLAQFRNNSWGLAGELDKIALGFTVRPPNILDPEEKIYVFLDALLDRRLSAPRLLLSLLKTDASGIYLFASLTGTFRNLMLIKKHENNEEALRRIQKEFTIHPFVFKKFLVRIKSRNAEELERIYRKLLEFDKALKLGEMNIEHVVYELLHNSRTPAV